jgi:3-oxoacyl-[acyl-carrier protein] reductase
MQKKVIVLGASSGIGKATAQRFAKQGWQVMGAAPEAALLQDAMSSLEGQGHHTVLLDVTSDTQIDALKEQVQKNFGDFDVLINSVGISQSQPLLGSDFDAWDRCLQVMLYGAVKVCRALLPLMKDGGRIVHITSIHYERVAPGSSAYGMAKAAITQLTRSQAVEFAPRNILANAIAPGFIFTPMSIKGDGRNELESEWFKENYIKHNHLPLKRAGQPEEVAGVAYFLAGPDASYITGSVVTVDGGLTITF